MTSKEIIQQILEALEGKQIIGKVGGSYEIKHDTLAAKINNYRTAEDKRRVDITQLVYVTEKNGGDLNERQLSMIEPYRYKLAIKDSDKVRLENYITDCIDKIEKKKIKEAATAKNIRRRLTISRIMVVMLVSALVLAGVFWNRSQKTSIDKLLQESIYQYKDNHFQAAYESVYKARALPAMMVPEDIMKTVDSLINNRIYLYNIDTTTYQDGNMMAMMSPPRGISPNIIQKSIRQIIGDTLLAEFSSHRPFYNVSVWYKGELVLEDSGLNVPQISISEKNDEILYTSERFIHTYSLRNRKQSLTPAEMAQKVSFFYDNTGKIVYISNAKNDTDPYFVLTFDVDKKRLINKIYTGFKTYFFGKINKFILVDTVNNDFIIYSSNNDSARFHAPCKIGKSVPLIRGNLLVLTFDNKESLVFNPKTNALYSMGGANDSIGSIRNYINSFCVIKSKKVPDKIALFDMDSRKVTVYLDSAMLNNLQISKDKQIYAGIDPQLNQPVIVFLREDGTQQKVMLPDKERISPADAVTIRLNDDNIIVWCIKNGQHKIAANVQAEQYLWLYDIKKEMHTSGKPGISLAITNDIRIPDNWSLKEFSSGANEDLFENNALGYRLSNHVLIDKNKLSRTFLDRIFIKYARPR